MSMDKINNATNIINHRVKNYNYGDGRLDIVQRMAEEQKQYNTVAFDVVPVNIDPENENLKKWKEHCAEIGMDTTIKYNYTPQGKLICPYCFAMFGDKQMYTWCVMRHQQQKADEFCALSEEEQKVVVENAKVEIKEREESIKKQQEFNDKMNSINVVGESFANGAIVTPIENMIDGVAMLGGAFTSSVVSIWDKEGSEKIQNDISNFVSYDMAGNVYDDQIKKYNVSDELAYGKVHQASKMAGTMFGYTALSYVSGGVAASFGTSLGLSTTAVSTMSTLSTATVSAFASAGSSGEMALRNGASFNEAATVSFISASVGFAAGGTLDKIGATARSANSLISALGYTGLGGVVAMSEPVINSVAEYHIYAKDMKDESGNALYENFGDYYKKSGGLTNTMMAGAIGIGSVGLNAASGLKNYNVNSNTSGVDDFNVTNKNNSAVNDVVTEKLFDYDGGSSPTVELFTTEKLNDVISPQNIKKQEAVKNFNFWMGLGAASDSDVLNLASKAYKDALDTGNVEAISILESFLYQKKNNLNINYQKPSEINKAFWRSSDKSLHMGQNFLEWSDTGTFFHETGHGLFDIVLNSKNPDNWRDILKKAKITFTLNNVEYNDAVGAFGQRLDSEASYTRSLAIKDFEKTIGTSVENYRNNLIQQYEKIFSGANSIFKFKNKNYLKKFRFSNDIIDKIVKGDITAQKLVDDMLETTINPLKEKYDRTLYGNSGALSDIIEAIFAGSPKDLNGKHFVTTYGHGSKYYLEARANGFFSCQFHEIIANYTQIKCSPNSTYHLNMLKNMCGEEFFDVLESTFQKMIKGG